MMMMREEEELKKKKKEEKKNNITIFFTMVLSMLRIRKEMPNPPLPSGYFTCRNAIIY